MLKRNIRLLTWFNFFTDFKFYAPFALIYFSQVAGSYALGASIFSIAMISAAIFEIPTGILSDFLGRRKTLILGAVSASIYISFYAIGTNYWILVVGAILEGLARSFYSGNNEALLHDTLIEEGKENLYHHYLGRISSMFQIGLAFSALIGSALAFWNIEVIFWFSIVSQLICIFLSLKIIEPKVLGGQSGNVYVHLKESIRLFLKNPKLRLLSLSNIFSFGFGEASWQFRPAFFASIWPTWALGFASVLSHLGAIIGFRIGARLMDKIGGLKILFLGSIFNRAIDFVFLIIPSFLSPVFMSITSLHYGMSQTVKGSLMQKEFTNQQRATMGSLNSFGGSVFFGLVYFLAGLLADKLNPRGALVILECFLLVNVYIYWKLFKKG